MKSMIVFMTKEILEQVRTYKTLILMTVLLLVGISSPILAKMMPEIIGSMDIGIEIKIPTPTYRDAFAQFFESVTQIVIIVIILVFSGVVSLEKTKGTVVLMLTKKLSRTSLLLSKFIAMVILWTVGYLLSIGAFLFYTFYLFLDVQLDGVALALFCLWLFAIVILAITLLASTLATNNYIGTIGAFGGWFMLLMTPYVPGLKKITPMYLATWNNQILLGMKSLKELSWSIGIGFLLIVFLLFITIQLVKKQEI